MPGTALSSAALCTVPEARDYIGESGIAAKKLIPIINGVSSTVQGYCERQFVPFDADSDPAVPRRFRYEGNGYLSFSPYELRKVDSITLFTDLPESSWMTLVEQTPTVESDYRLEPRYGSPGVGTYLYAALRELNEYALISAQLPAVMSSVRAGRGSEVTVTGWWGAGFVPDDVKLATLMTVDAIWKDPEGFANRQVAGAVLQQALPSTAIPPEAVGFLKSYRRVVAE